MRAFLVLMCLATPVRADDVTLFAAASLRTALAEIEEVWEGRTGTMLTVSYAASSALARQIQLGAPADLYISASPDWMDVLARDGLLAPGTRRDLLGNRLVLIGEAGASPVALDDIPAALGEGRLAMALVSAVPAGIYGKAALEALGAWRALSPRVVQTDNVRAALALVARREARLGIVYATDAGAEPRVDVVATFPAETHPPIRYPVALIRDSSAPAAREFLTYLEGPDARAILARHGFLVPDA